MSDARIHKEDKMTKLNSKPSPTQNTLIQYACKAGLWIAGIVVLLASFAGMENSFFGAILGIVAALLLIPSSFKKINKRFKKKMGPVVRILLAGLLIAFAMPMMYNSWETHTNANINYDGVLGESDSLISDSMGALINESYGESKQLAFEVIKKLSVPLKAAEGDKNLHDRVLARQTYATLMYKTAALLEQEKEIGKESVESLEIIKRGYEENAKEWDAAADLFETMDIDYADNETISDFRELAEIQRRYAENLGELIKEKGGSRATEIPAERKSVEEDIIPEELRRFFDSFDENKDNKLSIPEAQNFFYWVEKNIQYRYDDENYQGELIAGTLLGDGRPGSDYRQKPIETFRERAGDCEDMATLEQAFYTYYGINAEVVAVNAENENAPDHAVAVVWMADTVDEFKNALGRFFYYKANENARDVFGKPVKPGVYIIVDNAYSSAFGFISGGVGEGKFRIHCSIPLERGYGEEWNKIVRECSGMD